MRAPLPSPRRIAVGAGLALLAAGLTPIAAHANPAGNRSRHQRGLRCRRQQRSRLQRGLRRAQEPHRFPDRPERQVHLLPLRQWIAWRGPLRPGGFRARQRHLADPDVSHRRRRRGAPDSEPGGSAGVLDGRGRWTGPAADQRDIARRLRRRQGDGWNRRRHHRHGGRRRFDDLRDCSRGHGDDDLVAQPQRCGQRLRQQQHGLLARRAVADAQVPWATDPPSAPSPTRAPPSVRPSRRSP